MLERITCLVRYVNNMGVNFMWLNNSKVFNLMCVASVTVDLWQLVVRPIVMCCQWRFYLKWSFARSSISSSNKQVTAYTIWYSTVLSTENCTQNYFFRLISSYPVVLSHLNSIPKVRELPTPPTLERHEEL